MDRYDLVEHCESSVKLFVYFVCREYFFRFLCLGPKRQMKICFFFKSNRWPKKLYFLKENIFWKLFFLLAALLSNQRD